MLTLYFSFTTLVTVGFGDFSPTSNIERLLMVGIFVTGVAVFSVLTNNFLDSVSAFRKISSENEESEGLAKFLNLLKMYNKGAIRIKMKEKIEDHFQYQWYNDRLISLKDDEDGELYDQLDID